ncbi:ATP-binding protein [Micromonospora rubida]|uniref:ATP-binding protein n=1 Tax=Micromonospora rubida TaxID=2697657 RepID=UPI001F1CA672|nr:AAA family ATPase [Micromonospora rubida]
MAMREAEPGDPRQPSPRPSPPGFVGREAELAALGTAFDSGPAVVLIEGEAGIGKSRLVGEYLVSAAGRRNRSLVATCPHFREPYTLGPIVEAVRQATDRVADLPLSDLAGALRPLFPEWADELPAAPEPLGDVRASRHRLFRALLELLGNLDLAVLVVEDVHWADDATLELLLFLVARQSPPFSVVVTYRPEDVPVGSLLLRLTSRLPSTTTRLRLPVGPLDVSQTAQLVSSMLDAEHVSQTFAGFLHQRTAGIPLVVEESVRLLRDRADLTRVGGEWVRRRLDEIDVPPTVRDSVLERVARIGPHGQAVLRAAAVLAEPSDEATVTAVSALTPAEALDGLTEALGSGLLRENNRWLVSFRHALASRAVYEAIPAPQRRGMHLRAGLSLEDRPQPPVARLAYHFREAGRTAEWCRYAELAADLALESSDEATTAALLHDLLTKAELPARTVVRLVMKVPFGAFAGRDRHADVVDALRTVLAGGTLPPADEAVVRFRLGCVLFVTEDYEASRAELERAIQQLTHDPVKAARAMAFLAYPQGVTAPAETHLAWLRRASEMRASMSPADQLILTVDTASVRLMLGEEAGWEDAARLPADAESPVLRQELVRGQLNVGTEAVMWGRYAEAARRLTGSLQLAERHQYLRYRGWILATRLQLDWFLGEWSGLAERIDLLVDDEDLDPAARNKALLVRTSLQAAAGTLARDDDELLAASHTLGVADVGMSPAAVLARSWLVEGRVAEVLTLTGEALGIVAHRGVWIWATDLVPIRMDALITAERTGEAADLVAAYADGLRGRDAPAPLASLALCRAILLEAHGDRQGAATAYDRAAAAWQALPRPYDALLTRERQANCLIAAGQAEAGLALLAEVCRDLAGLGAHADAARTAELSRAHAVDERHDVRRGRRGYGDQLSPRELEVVRLVVTGRTNREIAQALSRSPRTVAAQLNSAMRKLGVSSRTAVAVSALESGVLTDPPIL